MPPLEQKIKSSRSRTGASSRQRPLQRLEWIALLHVGALFTLATWGFGGGVAWARTALTIGGAFGIFVLTAFAFNPANRGTDRLRPLHWLWPLVGFNALVLAGGLSPSFREMLYGTQTMLVPNLPAPWWQPSSARPPLALRELALFDALFLPCFNLALIVRSRRALRGLLLFVAGHALLLSVFGILQKLLHSSGLFFGAVKSPQNYFFASFIYHNHWGAFAVLVVAACLGLVWHHARRNQHRDFFHSPAFGGLLAVLLLAAAVPLSGSHSCTLLLVALISGASLHFIARFVRRRRCREDIAGSLFGIFAAGVVGAATVWYVAEESITLRLEKTREHATVLHAAGDIGSRTTLYKDTWRMAKAKLWLGWGMSSYPHVFMLYNTQESKIDRLPVFYADAHSDWLQSVAEHGIVGTLLLGLSGFVPLGRLRPYHFRNSLPAYLLSGCLLVLLYAWLDFPFGNAAVVLTWWLCFFCAICYARLEPPPAEAEAAV